MSVGLASRVGQDGKPEYMWFWEKFGVDFVREDGEWKIWHFQIYTDTGFSENMGGAMGGPPGAGPPPQGQGPSRGEGPSQGMQSDMNRTVQMYEIYSPTRVPQNIPRLPEPYETWEDTTPYIK
jgi:hypothetical protein